MTDKVSSFEDAHILLKCDGFNIKLNPDYLLPLLGEFTARTLADFSYVLISSSDKINIFMQKFFYVKIVQAYYILSDTLLTKGARKVSWDFANKGKIFTLEYRRKSRLITNDDICLPFYLIFFYTLSPSSQLFLILSCFCYNVKGGWERGEVSRSRYRQIIFSSNFSLVYILSHSTLHKKCKDLLICRLSVEVWSLPVTHSGVPKQWGMVHYFLLLFSLEIGIFNISY